MSQAWRGTHGVPTAVAFIVVLLASPLKLWAQSPESAPKLKIGEEVVATLGRTIHPIVVLPGGTSLLWSEPVALGTFGGVKRWRVFIDGKQLGEDADSVSRSVFSEDGVHSAFTVKRGTVAKILVDGVERGEFADTRGKVDFYNQSPPLIVGPGGKGVAHWTSSQAGPKKDRYAVRLLGHPYLPEVDFLDPIAVSGGTTPRLAYGILKDERWVMVVDGGEFEGPSKKSLAAFGAGEMRPFKGLTFSSDGKRFAYLSWAPFAAGKKTDGTLIAELLPVVFVDGKPVIPDSFKPFIFTPDGREYAVLRPEVFSPFIFSPDGTRVAFAMVTVLGHEESFLGRKTIRTSGRVVVNGVAGPVFEYSGPDMYYGPPETLSERPIISKLLTPSWGGVSIPAFSPDSLHIAYIARKGNREFALVVDGVPQPLPPVDRILRGPVYSPDGQHIACVGANKKEVVVNIDGKDVTRTPVEGADLVHSTTFSPDGHRIAFVAVRVDGQSYFHQVVIDGKASREFSSVYAPEPVLFSQEGRHSAFVAGGSVILDGLDGKKYSGIFWDSLSFSAEGTVGFFALDGKKVLRVTQSVK